MQLLLKVHRNATYKHIAFLQVSIFRTNKNVLFNPEVFLDLVSPLFVVVVQLLSQVQIFVITDFLIFFRVAMVFL